MDLSMIKDMLSDFSTFASKITDLFALVPRTLGQVAGWFYDGNLVGGTYEQNAPMTTGGNPALNIEKHWADTAGIFKPTPTGTAAPEASSK